MEEPTDTASWGVQIRQAFERRLAIESGTPLDDRSATRLLAASLEPPPGPGEQVGPFRLVESIGSGGFGEVFRAVQREPVERDVALKVLVGIDRGAGAISRFERERQVLVRLRHPGIVRLLEAGVTPSGLPWFAMDLVAGRTIDRWADEASPDLAIRLAVLRDLADAVAAAHRQGVLHRDLKPANILIAETESGPRVQVVDFGIAKVIDTGADGDGATRAGQVIGTPEYMSPEAASLESERLDTRSDVYALGLVAFRVLAGRSAIELPRGTPLADRLLAAARPTIPRLSAACREPRLARRLRGEIEWVVGRAIAVDPASRYPSAGELKEEFDRLLAGQPVAAAPPSAAYQFRAFTRRHKAIVAAAAVSVAALAAATAVSGSFAVSEARQRARAENALAAEATERSRAEAALSGEARERARAEAALQAEATRREELARVAAFQEASLAAIDVERLGVDLREAVRSQVPLDDAPRRQTLEAALAAVDFTDLARRSIGLGLLEGMPSTIRSEFDDQPAVAGRLLMAVSETCLALGLLEDALEAASQARAVFEASEGPAHRSVLAAAVNQHEAAVRLGRSAEFVEELADWWTLGQRILPTSDPLRSSLGRALAASLGNGRHDEALAILDGLDAESDAAGIDRDLLVADARADLLEQLGRLEEALALRQSLLAAIESGDLRGVNERLRRDSIRFILRLRAVNLLSDLGRNREAVEASEAMLSEMTTQLGGDHPRTLIVLGDHATLLRQAGMPEEAASIEGEVVAKRRQQLGDRHPDTIRAIQNLALSHRQLQRLEESESLLRDAMRLAAESLPPDDLLRLTVEVNFGGLLLAADQPEEALAVLEGVYPRLVEAYGVEHPRTVSARRNLGVVLNDLGRYEEALPIFEEGLAATERNNGPEARTTIVALANLGGLYRSLDRLDESLATLDDAIGRARGTLPENHWNIGVFLTYRGRTLIDLGRFAEAVATLEEAAALLEAALGPPHPRSVEARRRLVEALDGWHLAEPDGGHGENAARWRATLPAEP